MTDGVQHGGVAPCVGWDLGAPAHLSGAGAADLGTWGMRALLSVDQTCAESSVSENPPHRESPENSAGEGTDEIEDHF